MIDRPFIKLKLADLAALVKEKPWDVFTLSRVREELTYRKTDGARQLLTEVEALIDGRIPRPPKPSAPDHAENQIELLGGDGK